MIKLLLAWLLLAMTPYEEACVAYKAGEVAEEPQEAAQYFNQALEIYQKLAMENPSPALLSNVGNCYFQLGEYPWAILYYERALAFTPRDRTIKQRLDTARTLLELGKAQPSMLQYLLGGHLLSLAERVWLCGLFGLGLAIAGSVALWTRAKGAYRAALTFALLSLLSLSSVALLEFSSSANAVVVQSAMVRCDAGSQYSPVSPTPIPSGAKVTVKGLSSDWVEIASADGRRGFIPAKHLRLV